MRGNWWTSFPEPSSASSPPDRLDDRRLSSGLRVPPVLRSSSAGSSSRAGGPTPSISPATTMNSARSPNCCDSRRIRLRQPARHPQRDDRDPRLSTHDVERELGRLALGQDVRAHRPRSRRRRPRSHRRTPAPRLDHGSDSCGSRPGRPGTPDPAWPCSTERPCPRSSRTGGRSGDRAPDSRSSSTTFSWAFVMAS